MRTILTIVAVVAVLVLGKIFFFKKPEEKGMGGGPGGAPSAGKGGEKGKDGKDGKPAGPPVSVNVFVVNSETLDNVVTASGTIYPNEEVELRAEASGRITALSIKEGSRVAAGQIIAKIKDTDLQAQLKKLNYEIELAKQTEARQKKLLDINAISKEEYEITANKINTLNADKELIEANLEKTVLKAPFAGKIGLKNVSQGAYVTPTTSLATLVQTNPVKIDFSIPEKYSTQMRVGRGVKFEVEGQSETYTANVVAIDPKIDPNLRTLKLRAIAKNPADRLLPGMFVRVSVDLDITQAIMIPTEAVVPVLKGKKVYVVRDGKANEVMIETGLRTDKKIQVTSGLSAGDSLIVTGIMALKKDSPVKIKSPQK
ncbi:efflux transporter, RND family, MFP subunit [Emticicia oligotrophica DSM 17448]|uniref:Efflux transporter, RND family, MFP subunit n=1 Tax=Emticicia oligotrophica (strain DSM 17448 / CIP 109782 / MTCC 6937 / GPTSA100-15) TaxID=929562 RepID=A0ABM5N3G5_EMTOG|nr:MULTISPECIES: efflux RND transporter periplasmic adaptor subunit [Emticicia]AFK03982.1 efflux transporter, RND family, MFP subunit [Emticicia oligotrophica DSM 17448]